MLTRSEKTGYNTLVVIVLFFRNKDFSMQIHLYKFVFLLLLASNLQAMVKTSGKLLRKKCFTSVTIARNLSTKKDLQMVDNHHVNRYNQTEKLTSFVTMQSGPRFSKGTGCDKGEYSFKNYNRTVSFSYLENNMRVLGYISDTKSLDSKIDSEDTGDSHASSDLSQLKIRDLYNSGHSVHKLLNTLPDYVKATVFDKLLDDVNFFTNNNYEQDDSERIDEIFELCPKGLRDHLCNVVADLTQKNWQNQQISRFKTSWVSGQDYKHVKELKTYVFTGPRKLSWTEKYYNLLYGTGGKIILAEQECETPSIDKIYYFLGVASSATPYEILKVSPNATTTEIKEAYLDLAKKWHPDHNKTSHAEQVFKIVQSAYSKIKNKA